MVVCGGSGYGGCGNDYNDKDDNGNDGGENAVTMKITMTMASATTMKVTMTLKTKMTIKVTDDDDDAKEKTKYHADPEKDVAPRAANSSGRFILFTAPPSIILTPLALRVPPLFKGRP